MTTTQQDIIHSVTKQLEFMGGMLLAWDLDAIEFGATERDGVFYMLECLRKELNSVATVK